jgi:Cof subfamily protein (haloacid dehalogenase superfamily)
MPIRLLACDLDGTLADHHGHISDEAVAALDRARAEGILLVVATGRLPFVIGPFLDRLDVSAEPFITAQGALIGHRDGRILRRLTLDAAIAREAAAIARAWGAGMAFFHEDQIIVDGYAFPPAQYEAWFGQHGRLEAAAAAHLDGDLIKFMAIHPDVEAVPALVDGLRAALGPRAEITRSWHHFVEGTTPGADQGAALAWLCARLGVARDEVLALGDGGNDVTMLRWAGQSAAPANGDPAALAVAGWVAPPLLPGTSPHPAAASLAHFLAW